VRGENRVLLLVHADTIFTSAVTLKQPKGSTVVYRLINNGNFVNGV